MLNTLFLLAQAQNLENINPELINTMEQVPQDNSISIVELIQNGGLGGQIILAILLLLSILTVYIFVERFMAIRKEAKEDLRFLLAFKDFVSEEKIDSARELSERHNSLTGRVYAQGLNLLHRSENDRADRIEKIANQEIHAMEAKLPTLATIAGAAPMMGFLGTVIGMIVVFHNMATAGGKIELELLSNGIYTAMTTTVAGLIVGIMAYIAYNHLVAKMSKVAFKLESDCDEFVDFTSKTRR